MKKCTICGGKVGSVQHLTDQHQNVLNLLRNDVDQHEKWLEKPDSIINTPNGPLPVVCELDWLALMWNGWDYIWDGTDLLGYIKSEDEWFEVDRMECNEWEPSKPRSIKFVFNDNNQKWEVKVR